MLERALLCPQKRSITFFWELQELQGNFWETLGYRELTELLAEIRHSFDFPELHAMILAGVILLSDMSLSLRVECFRLI